ILIDVREPAEYAAGHIPTAKNLPIMTRPDGFFLPKDEFRDAFGWEKPEREAVAVFYCKAGIRSRAAAGLARQAGWEGAREYPGSWMDWVEREKE
ncbi:Rhodanese-like protein, partial [Terfezia boudieri ATCC MYA-4762]